MKQLEELAKLHQKRSETQKEGQAEQTLTDTDNNGETDTKDGEKEKNDSATNQRSHLQV